MRGSQTSRSLLLATLLTAALGGLVLAAAAEAVEVRPLLDTSVVDRVHELVPLGASGSSLAMNATSSTPGRKAGAHSYLVKDGVYVADADGHGLRQLWGAEEGVTLEDLTATDDGTWGAFTLSLDLPRVIDFTTGRTRDIHGPHSRDVDGFAMGHRRLFATLRDGRGLARLDAHGKLSRIPGVGLGDHSSYPQAVVRSDDEQQLGVCRAVVHGRRATSVRVSALDLGSGVVHGTSVVGAPAASLADRDPFEMPTCGVSRDGSTVATIVRSGARTALVSFRHGRRVSVSVPRGVLHVGALSPTGRYALVGGGVDAEIQMKRWRQVDAVRPVDVVDLDSGTVRPVTGLAGRLHRRRGSRGTVAIAQAVWAPDEQRLAFAPSSGGLVIADVATGATRFVPTPAPPVGYRFAGPGVRPLGFSADGEHVAFGVYDSTEDITALHPFSVSADGQGAVEYLLSSSMRSFQALVRSADGSKLWLLPSSTCHTVYPQPLLRIDAGEPWGDPFSTAQNPFA